MGLRVGGRLRLLPVAAVAVTFVITIPTVPTFVMTAIAAEVVVSLIAWCDIPHRLARRWAGMVNHHGWTGHRIRRTHWCGDHGLRRVTHRSGEREVYRPTRLRRGGEPDHGNHSNQTEQRLCFPEWFDGVFAGFFNGRKQRDVFQSKAVTENLIQNE